MPPKMVLGTIKRKYPSTSFSGTEEGWLDPGKPDRSQIDRIRPLVTRIQKNQNKQRVPSANRKGRDGITHADCRNLAYACEPMRLMIETRKDQITKRKWNWVLKQEPGETPEAYKTRSENSPNVKKLNQFFKKPDGKRTMKQWLRLILEEMIVLDDVYIYRQPNLLGELELDVEGRMSADGMYGLKIVDGETINKLVDEDGDIRPEPPDIAYQQIIHGRVVADFTTDEMFNYMRNQRVNHSYGYGPVEQTIYFINMSLKRSTMQLGRYTEGNMPAALFGVPDTWSPTDIENFQTYWDALLTGNFLKMSKGIFVPGGITPIFPQLDALKDEFDEYIIRWFAYALSVSPTALIRNLNRAAAEQTRDQADEEGLQVWTSDVCNLLDTLVEEWFEIDDCEVKPQEDRSTDPKKQAEVDEIYIRMGVKSIDEVRERNGDNPIGIGNAIITRAGLISLVGQQDQIGAAVQFISTEPREQEAGTAPSDKTVSEATTKTEQGMK
jgi:hypothetical protein